MKKLPKQLDVPMPVGSRTEIDAITELDPKHSGHYQLFVGVLRWKVKLGRMGTCLEVFVIDSCAALPRHGQSEIECRIFAHIKKYYDAEMTFDPSVSRMNKMTLRNDTQVDLSLVVLLKLKVNLIREH